MGGERRRTPPVRAVLLDAMGTLVTFRDPASRLRAAVRRRLGVEVALEAAEAAMREEIAYYGGRVMDARDAASLAAVRRDCGAVVARALGLAGADARAVTGALLEAIAWEPYPEAATVVAALRARGKKVAVVSNWDAGLPEVLAATGLEDVDAVLASAVEGVAKPDPQLLRRALDRLGVAPEAALHAGDSVAEDVGAARAAGVRPVLVARDGAAGPPGVPAVPDLRGLLALAP
jgi:putative hydrolase of the HAD superfamily